MLQVEKLLIIKPKKNSSQTPTTHRPECLGVIITEIKKLYTIASTLQEKYYKWLKTIGELYELKTEDFHFFFLMV